MSSLRFKLSFCLERFDNWFCSLRTAASVEELAAAGCLATGCFEVGFAALVLEPGRGMRA